MKTSQKNTLRKLTFLGFGTNRNDGGGGGQAAGDGELRLDDECAKVFAMGDHDDAQGGARATPDASYDFYGSPPPVLLPRYTDTDYTQHRKRSYPHPYAPLKMAPPTRAMRRPHHQRSLEERSSATPPSLRHATPPVGSSSLDATPPVGSPLSLADDDTTTAVGGTDTATGYESTTKSRQDSDQQIGSSILHEASEEGGRNTDHSSESESECVVSDPCNYHTPEYELSPERKVQFLNSEIRDKFDVDGLKDKKKRRVGYQKHRKLSLPDEGGGVGGGRRHHHHHHHNHHHGDAPLRISTQPEDESLAAADRDQLDSHRSDDPRALRRHKTSRLSNVSMVNIGKGVELHPSLKKLYDHSPHAIFVELGELFTTETVSEREWKETARWIKYEEDVEEGVDRWGKPHVASLSFHSLLNLRKCLEDGVVILDLEERDLPAIAYRVSEELFKEDLIREEDKSRIMRLLLLRHRHVNDHHHDHRSGLFFGKKHSYTSLQSLYNAEQRKVSVGDPSHLKNGDAESKLLGLENHTTVDMKDDIYSVSTEDIRRARNEAIMKKIPPGAQGSSVLVGEVDFLEQPAIAFVRLAEGVVIPSLIEVNIPVRFIFILLGPKRANLDYHEVGRSISTLMSNEHFHGIAFKAESRKELLSAINEFLDDSIVLPPGDWERQALLPIEELKAKSEAIRRRKENAIRKAEEARGVPLLTAVGAGGGGDDGKKPPFPPNPLERTKKPWGGLLNDLKRRYPYYKSDILEGINAQCVAAAIFMYFAAVSGAIAFGGLLSDKTRNQIGICETLLCTSVAGIIFAMFSGQPLVIVGTTGPLLLFDESLYQFCLTNGLEYLTTRVYIGIWLAVIGISVACFEGSVLVKLFTRFTEDIFSALIVLLYIIEAIMKVCFLYEKHPILANYCEVETMTYKNISDIEGNNTKIISDDTNGTAADVLVQISSVEKLPGKDDRGPINQPNTALFCMILTLGTFSIAYYLKMFRNSQFLGRSARRALGDFGVPIAIVFMVTVDYMVPEVFTEKLNVPEGLSPSDSETRGWFIPPGGTFSPTPLWVMFASIVPAMLVYILLFMETHITELIIDKKERKLRKGSGFHLDIVLVCLINVLSGLFGFPWMCAATVRSIAHTSALTVMSRTHAPGEKPHIIEVKEQRLSSLMVATLIGLSVLMAPLLRLVPMAVLFGIFLYMGFASMDGIQFFDRLRLLFMPVKHHPRASYVRKVRTAKMHLFTLIQLLCLIMLWVVKSTKASLAFPFFLLMMVPLRAQLQRIFTQKELRALDGDQVDADDDEPDFYAEAPLPG